MNAARFAMLSSSSSAITLLNLINSVLIRHHHCFYFALVRIASFCSCQLRFAVCGAHHAYTPFHEPIYDLSGIIQDMVADNSGVSAVSWPPWPSARDRLAYELALFKIEYQAMLYGGNVRSYAHLYIRISRVSVSIRHNPHLTAGRLPLQTINSTSPHFTMSSTGIVTTDNPGREVLYVGGSCMCDDKASAMVWQ